MSSVASLPDTTAALDSERDAIHAAFNRDADCDFIRESGRLFSTASVEGPQRYTMDLTKCFEVEVGESLTDHVVSWLTGMIAEVRKGT